MVIDLLIFFDILLNLTLKCNLALLIEGNEIVSRNSLLLIILVPPFPY